MKPEPAQSKAKPAKWKKAKAKRPSSSTPETDWIAEMRHAALKAYARGRSVSSINAPAG